MSSQRQRRSKRSQKKRDLLRKNRTIEKQTDAKKVIHVVVECTVCKHRKYYSRFIVLIPPLKIYCPFCQTRTQFDIVPQDKWDAFASDEFDGGRKRNVGRPKHARPNQQGEQKPLVPSGESLGSGTPDTIPKGRLDIGTDS